MITGIISRSGLLLGLGWLLGQKGKSVITLFGKGFDLASLVMILGGLFLIYKSVKEIHNKLEGEDPNVNSKNKNGISFGYAIGQIMLIDAVFSFDSIITAGGTADREIFTWPIPITIRLRTTAITKSSTQNGGRLSRLAPHRTLNEDSHIRCTSTGHCISG